MVALVDASGNTVATYSYDVFGGVTATENLPGGWSNPYRYDGKDRVRYDSETGLYWMSVRAYDPTLGRFLSRDPLKRSPLFGPSTQPYVYGDNNPLKNVDPSGQLRLNVEGGTSLTTDLRHGTCNIAMCPHVRTSGGAGSGANGQPGTEPPIPNDFVVSHTAAEVVAGMAAAQHAAAGAYDTFHTMEGVFIILGALAAFIGVGLLLSVDPAMIAMAGMMAAAVLDLAILALEANRIADVFNDLKGNSALDSPELVHEG